MKKKEIYIQNYICNSIYICLLNMDQKKNSLFRCKPLSLAHPPQRRYRGVQFKFQKNYLSCSWEARMETRPHFHHQGKVQTSHFLNLLCCQWAGLVYSVVSVCHLCKRNKARNVSWLTPCMNLLSRFKLVALFLRSGLYRLTSFPLNRRWCCYSFRDSTAVQCCSILCPSLLIVFALLILLHNLHLITIFK